MMHKIESSFIIYNFNVETQSEKKKKIYQISYMSQIIEVTSLFLLFTITIHLFNKYKIFSCQAITLLKIDEKIRLSQIIFG